MMHFATAARFQELCHRVGVADPAATTVFAALVRHYSEDHRRYHNLAHIDRMLGWLDIVGENLDAIELAIWFHDVIYDPLGTDNEDKSARFFRDGLGRSLPSSLADAVERLILATDLKRARSGRDDENLMIDIDLSILGASPGDYAAYRDAIRSEYAVVPEESFRAGRGAILRHFLSQPIYHTQSFQQLEPQARRNMQQELASLEPEGDRHP